MVQVMQELGGRVAAPIAAWVGQMEEINQTMGPADTEPDSEIDYSSDIEPPLEPAKPSFERDPELEREERLIHALQEKKRVESRLEDALEQLKEAQEREDALQDELEEARYTLD